MSSYPSGGTTNPLGWVVNDMGGKIAVPSNFNPEQYATNNIDLSKVDQVNMFPGTPLSRVQAYLPMMVGIWLDTMMLGVILMLFTKWAISTRPTERPMLQFLVYWIIIAGVAGSGWFVAQMMQFFGRGFGDFSNAGLRYYVRWFGVITISSRLPALIFLLHRAYLLCDRRKWLLFVFSPLLLGITTADLASVAMLNSVNDAARAKRMLGVGAGLEVVTDFALSILIAIRLRKLKTGFPGTDRLIHKLIIDPVPTGYNGASVSHHLPRLPSVSCTILRPILPQVSTILILIVLNSRMALQQQSSQGAFANGPKHVSSSGPPADGSRGGIRTGDTAGAAIGSESWAARPHSAYGRRSALGSRVSAIRSSQDEASDARGVPIGVELDGMANATILYAQPGHMAAKTGQKRAKDEELGRVSEEDQKSHTSAAPSDAFGDAAADGSKVNLVGKAL